MKKDYLPEEAFVIALKNCTDSKDLNNTLSEIVTEDIGTGRMDMYDKFINKYSSLKFCYGCQIYHDKKETLFEDDQCKKSLEDIINLNKSLAIQGQKHREEMTEKYYHR